MALTGAPLVIVGAGPAGLVAADVLSAAGRTVVIYERMPSVARKFLMAGRGGLNLTHSEPLEHFLEWYGGARVNLAPMIDAFPPAALIEWCAGLGQETFIGTSRRVFPKAMKASPLLRAWLMRLQDQGVRIVTRATWRGWDDAGSLVFDGAAAIAPAATLLALGGGSWPRLGSDGGWRTILEARGVALTPFQPANVGFYTTWSDSFRTRFAGAPLKSVSLRHQDRTQHGEVMITRYGIEGGALYALSPAIRDSIARDGQQAVHIDLRPHLSQDEISARLARGKRSDSITSRLRKTLNLTPPAINMLRECGPWPSDTVALAQRIKAAPVVLSAPHGLERAISTAGGVQWSSVDETLQLRAAPRVFVAGEMLDWEAPTGGYLLQACFSTGVWAAHAMLKAARGRQA